mgnify:CR=1 FL=1
MSVSVPVAAAAWPPMMFTMVNRGRRARPLRRKRRRRFWRCRLRLRRRRRSQTRLRLQRRRSKTSLRTTAVTATDTAAEVCALDVRAWAPWLRGGGVQEEEAEAQETEMEGEPMPRAAGGFWQRPIELGCDLVIQSTTKFYDGHNITVGGAVICATSELHERIKHMQNVHGNIMSPQNAPCPRCPPTSHFSSCPAAPHPPADPSKSTLKSVGFVSRARHMLDLRRNLPTPPALLRPCAGPVPILRRPCPDPIPALRRPGSDPAPTLPDPRHTDPASDTPPTPLRQPWGVLRARSNPRVAELAGPWGEN